MSEVKVRAAQAADEKALMALAVAEMRAHEKLDPRFRLREDALDRYAVYLRNRMRDIDSTVFVAVDGDQVLGLAIGSIRKQNGFFEVQRYGYVSDLMVSPTSRRQGIGRALYDRIVLWFRGLGIEVIRLHMATRSDEARSFWKRVGAEEFLTEAWIDIAAAEAKEPVKPREATSEAGETAAGSAPGSIEASSRSSGPGILGDALLGGPERGI